MLKRFLLISALLTAAPVIGVAQEETLADIRQQLSVLYLDIQRLKTELSTSGGLSQGTTGNTPLDRLNSIEEQLQRLTSKTEELEFRVNRITVDGTNRVGDLEFRLCELETNCDIGQLGDTPTLGGVDNEAVVPEAQASNETGDVNLAVGERADFDRAQDALAAGDFGGALEQLTAFTSAYPGSSLTSRASLLRGQALEALGQMPNAARAYLESFSGDPTGEVAPEALYKLGFALGALGQTQDACLTLGEVGIRFPGSPAVLEAQSSMRNFGCN